MWHWFAHLDLNTLLLIVLGILTAWREARSHRWEEQDRHMRAQAKAERDDISTQLRDNTALTAAIGQQVAENHGTSLDELIAKATLPLQEMLERNARDAGAETQVGCRPES